MKSIPLDTEKVRTILKNQATVIRRPIKWLPHDAEFIGWKTNSGNEKSYGIAVFEVKGKRKYYKPQYLIGDILYVRETWSDYDGGGSSYLYKADYIEPKWKSSIHMPKEVARLFLRVTDVRIEGLKDIPLDNLQNEGFLCEWVYEFEVITKEEAMKESEDGKSF